MLTQPYIVDLTFDDFDDYTETICGWNMECKQLDKGRFHGKLHQVFSGNILMSHIVFSRHLTQQGESPEGMLTIGIPATPDQNFRWRDNNVTGNNIVIFPEDRELDAVSRTGFDVLTISLSENVLLQTAQQQQNKDVIKILSNSGVIKVPESVMIILRNQLQHYHQALINNPDLLRNHAFTDELNSDLPQHLLDALVSSQQNSRLSSPGKRRKALKKILVYIDEFSNEAPKIPDLCRVAKVSDRTLRYIFMDHFGVPPKTYLLRYRLNKVRHVLRNPESATKTITDIANQWGFWHMGQFAADYRKLFWELPSETRWAGS